MPDQDFQPSQQDIADYLKSNPVAPPSAPKQPSAAEQLLPWLAGATLPGLGKAAAGAVGAGAKALLGKGATALATMGGPLARLANLRKLDDYHTMKAAGVTPEKIYDQTGWFEGPGGHPLHEISDLGMKAKPMPAKAFGTSRGLAENFIDHPNLFENYPGAKKMSVVVDPGFGSERTGMFEPGQHRITIGGPTGDALTPDQQGTLLHELGGHYVGKQEGAGAGSDPEFVRDRIVDILKGRKFDLLNKGMPPTDPQILKLNNDIMTVNKNADFMYRGHPEEVKARAITDRFMKQKYGFGPENMPLGLSDPNETSRKFAKSGLALDPVYTMRSIQNYPSGYSLGLRGNPSRRVPVSTVDPELRAKYDRLPVESGFNHPYMAGEFKYPWKSEDTPRSMVRDWHIPHEYEDIPQDWLEALRQGK